MPSKLNHRQLITSIANDNPLVSTLQFIRDDPAGFSISDIRGHGMMNTILRANSADGKHSVIIKHGETTARLNPNEKVSLDRQVMEYNALELLQSILPGRAPQPYCLDRTHNIICMEDMSSWELLGTQLEAGRVDVEAAANLGCLLANMHVSTSKKHITPQRWEELVAKYNCEEMRKKTCSFQYVRSYDETASDNSIPEAALPAFREFVKEIHDMGIPQKQIEKYQLLDFEFSFLGAASQNVAMPITAYLFFYNNEDSTQKPTPEKLKFRTDSVQAVKNMLNAYMETHPDLSDEDSQAAFLTDVALFLGGSLVLLGIYFLMDESHTHTDANRVFLFTRGFLIMKSHEEMNNIDKFVKTVFQI